MTVINHKSISGITSITTPAGSDNLLTVHTNNQTERLRIDSSGNVLVGTTDTTLYNNTQSSGTGIMLRGGHAIDIARSGDLQLTLNRLTNEGPNIALYQAGGLKGTIGTKGGGIYFGTNGNDERLRIDSSGLIANNARVPSNFGSPNLLISGTDSTLTLMGDGSTNNTSFTGIKFRVAGGSHGDYTKAGIFSRREGGYNDLSLIFALDTVADATSVSIADEKMRITSAGKVGIGVTNPSSTSILHLRTSTNHNLEFEESAGNLRISALNDARSVNEVLEFAASKFNFLTGKVGIGNRTSTPGELLHVHTGSGAAVQEIEGATDATLILRSHSGDSYIKFADASSSNVGRIDYDHGSDSLAFRTNSDEALRIASDQKVGIGITNPAEKFEVKSGNIAIVGMPSGGGYKIDTHPLVSYASFTAISGGTYAARLGSTGSSTIRSTQIYGGGSHIATFDGVNDRLGISTTAPGAKLEVKGSTGTTGLGILTKDAAYNNVFWTMDGGRVGLHYNPLVINQDIDDNHCPSGTYFYVHHTSSPFIIKNDGKVGVGLTNPEGKIHVYSANRYIQELEAQSGITAGTTSGTIYRQQYTTTSGSSRRMGFFGLKRTHGSGDQRANFVMELCPDNSTNIGLASPAANTTSFEFKPSGEIWVKDGGGIDFSAETNEGASSQNTTLADYEEGTWTPTNSIGLTLTVNNTAHYIKVGKLVTVWFDVSLTGNPDSAQCSVIQSLPYMSYDGNNFYGQSNSVWYSNNNDAKRDHDDDNTLIFVDKDSTTIKIWNVTSGHNRVRSWAASSSSVGRRFRGTVTYRAKN